MSSNLPAADPHFHGHGTFDSADEVEHFGTTRSAFDFRYIAAAIRAEVAPLLA